MLYANKIENGRIRYTEKEQTIGTIILNQLGGQHFIAMTGIKHFVQDSKKRTLEMRLPRNHSKANFLIITLAGDDTYTMEFKRITMPRLSLKTGKFIEGKDETIERFETVYFDQLQELFTRVTWMYTHL